ncbi:MAG: hypothetical protein EON48_04090 [Acetobacteraceae bacterium]|nr:MAG: hypothetical protein EON48_04090 [Acetobacteraceae bacterium]
MKGADVVRNCSSFGVIKVKIVEQVAREPPSMSTVILAGVRGFLLMAATGFVVTALPKWPTDRWWVRYLDYLASRSYIESC